MRRNLLLITIILLSLALAPAAQAKSGGYVGVQVGMAGVFGDDILWDDDVKSDGDFFSWGVGLFVGYDLSCYYPDTPLRIEAELMYRSGEEFKKSGTYSGTYIDGKFELNWMTTFLVSLWYDIPAEISAKPYIGFSAGLGIISYDLDAFARRGSLTATLSEDGTAAAFLIGPGAGLRYDLTEDIVLDGRLRFLLSSDYDIEGEDYGAPMIDFNLGLAYRF